MYPLLIMLFLLVLLLDLVVAATAVRTVVTVPPLAFASIDTLLGLACCDADPPDGLPGPLELDCCCCCCCWMAVVMVEDETCDSRLEWVLVRVDDSFSLSKLDGPDVVVAYVILPLSILDGPLAGPGLRLVFDLLVPWCW